MKSRLKKIPEKREGTEIDPRFAPVAEAFAKNRYVSGGMMMSSYGLKVKGKIFAFFGRGKFVVKLPRARKKVKSERDWRDHSIYVAPKPIPTSIFHYAEML